NRSVVGYYKSAGRGPLPFVARVDKTRWYPRRHFRRRALAHGDWSMRFVVAALLGMIVPGPSLAEKPAKESPASRYGVAVDLKTYPQGMPKEALTSVLKAI